MPDGKLMILNEWDPIRFRVKKGLEKLGYDIAIVRYSTGDDIALGKRKQGNRKS
jgi:hypothetical protein